MTIRRSDRKTGHPEADAKADTLLPPATLTRGNAKILRFESVLRKQRETDKKSLEELHGMIGIP